MPRRLLSAAAACTLLLGLAACGEGGDGPVTTPPPTIDISGPSDGGGDDGAASDGGGDDASPSAAPEVPAPDPADYPGMDENTPEGAEQAFRYYERHLGGRITGLVRHGEQPHPALPADWTDKVMHARIEIGSTALMGADVAHAEPMRSAYLTLSLPSEEEAERTYAALTDGGELFMKMAKTPFANRFAMLRDRFGTSWMLLHQPASG